MSRIKLVAVILICIFLLPCMVNAEECNQNSIKIQSISLKDKSEYTEELTEATIDNNKINLDLKMYDVGDYIEYTLKVKNESDENYYFDENSLNINSNYFDYPLSYKDNSNKIEPNKEKIIYLKVQYKKEVEKENFFSGKYKDNNIVSLLLTNNKKSIFTNPLTGSNKIILLLIIMILLGIYLYYKKTNNLRLNIFIILGLSLLIPISTYALCEVKLDINSNITIGKVKPNPCTYDGELVQGAEYVNGQYTYRYMQEGTFDNWQNIENDGWGVKLTDKESTDDVTSKLCTSINDKPIVSMSSMFMNSRTSNIDLSSFDTSNVTNMFEMFYEVRNTEEYDTSSFNTSNVTDMQLMFEYNTSLKKIDLSGFDTHSVIYMYGLLAFSDSLESIVLDNWDITGLQYNRGFVSSIIYGSNNIKSISMKNWKISENFESGSAWIESDKLESIDVTNWDLSKTKSIRNLFANVHSKEIKGLETWDTSNIEDISYMFYDNNNLEKVNLSSWNTSKVTDMQKMFYSCDSLKEIDLSNFDTSNVTDMSDMFKNDISLEKANFDNFDISKSTYTYESIFSSTPNLKELSLKNWKLSEIVTRIGMESGSNVLEYIDVTGWDLSKTKDLHDLFVDLNTKKYIGLETWDTSNIENMSYMFDSNDNIEILDLSSWNTENVTNMEGMFCRNPKLKTIYVSDKFKTDNVVGYGTYWLFNNSPSLVGGNGTVYDSNHVDKEYARIDTPEAPRYFTRK